MCIYSFNSGIIFPVIAKMYSRTSGFVGKKRRNHIIWRSQGISVSKNREIYLKKSMKVYKKFSDEFKYFLNY